MGAAAGTWTRYALQSDCLAIAVSSHRYGDGDPMISPDSSIHSVNQVHQASTAFTTSTFTAVLARGWASHRRHCCVADLSHLDRGAGGG